MHNSKECDPLGLSTEHRELDFQSTQLDIDLIQLNCEVICPSFNPLPMVNHVKNYFSIIKCTKCCMRAPPPSPECAHGIVSINGNAMPFHVNRENVKLIMINDNDHRKRKQFPWLAVRKNGVFYFNFIFFFRIFLSSSFRYHCTRR